MVQTENDHAIVAGDENVLLADVVYDVSGLMDRDESILNSGQDLVVGSVLAHVLGKALSDHEL